jgi:hypothetical protein
VAVCAKREVDDADCCSLEADVERKVEDSAAVA